MCWQRKIWCNILRKSTSRYYNCIGSYHGQRWANEILMKKTLSINLWTGLNKRDPNILGEFERKSQTASRVFCEFGWHSDICSKECMNLTGLLLDMKCCSKHYYTSLVCVYISIAIYGQNLKDLPLIAINGLPV